MPGTRSSRYSYGNLEGNEDESVAMPMTYEEIMGFGPTATATTASNSRATPGVEALSSRLVAFRQWLSDEAKVKVHPSICVVNGEATDGTRNAPVLAFGPPPGAQTVAKALETGRVGVVDRTADRALYERTMGCQIRTAREIKKDEVMMVVPRSAMITPDLVAASDAGRAVLACCQTVPKDGEKITFWDCFENTTICETKVGQKVARNTGTQLLVKILQERKRAEAAFSKAMAEVSSSTTVDGTQKTNTNTQCKLAAPGTISTRAPILAFLIHQRFSPSSNPLVVSETTDTMDQFQKIMDTDGTNNALSSALRIKLRQNSPSTFGPYARTLPSSVSLPICWKRNELALLAGCIPGTAPLQEIASRTLQLATEFVALIEAGILKRFPATFPSGLITWERWVWAASVFTSRVLPVTCYLDRGDTDAKSYVPHQPEEEIQSPRDVWDELGVLVPLLDMVNHESDSHQLVWEPCVPDNSATMQDTEMNDSQDPVDEPHPPRAIMSKRVRKGQQIYTNYGADVGNQVLILQYGFAQMGNDSDEVRLGWGLMDAVGNVPTPADFTPPSCDELGDNAGKNIESHYVFESTESDLVNAWWSDERLALLEKEAFGSVEASFMSSLKMGKKMMSAAHSDGTYCPILITASLIGTMPSAEVQSHATKAVTGLDEKANLVITKRHQHVLRAYLAFIFTRKLEKLLENLNNGLKAHFGTLELWTKASKNGIRYKPSSDDEVFDSNCIGWQTFFDEHAYSATMEVEKQYYAIGPDSCVLTLYDGQLQSLQSSLDGLSTWEKFETGVLRQLTELGFTISKEDTAMEMSETTKPVLVAVKEEPSDVIPDAATMKRDQKRNDDGQKKEEGKPSQSKSRRRNRKRKNAAVANTDKPPAIKLHIGNLSYSTSPSDLYDFFAGLYGRDNVLECHIPTGRETGKSRGFGFVTLPDNIARQVLQSGRKHEVDHRVLKIAESNSAGSGKPNRGTAVQSPVSSDRCGTCGYRPKYCVCSVSNIPGHSAGVDAIDPSRDYDYQGGSGRYKDDKYSRSRSPYYGSRRGERDWDYGRDYGRDNRYSYYDRSRSRSYSRGRDRERDKSRRDRKSSDRRDRSHERSREGRSSTRHSSRSRGTGRSWERRSSRGSSRQSRSRSYSEDSGRDRKTSDSAANKQSDGRRGSPSRSPAYNSDEGRTRESQKRSSRSRSRGRSRKSRKKKRHTRSRSRSVSSSSLSK